MLINKPWRVACSPGSTLPEILCKRCDRSHEHARCQGVYTRDTQSYTEDIVNIVHKSISKDVNRHAGSFVCAEIVSSHDLSFNDALRLGAGVLALRSAVDLVRQMPGAAQQAVFGVTCRHRGSRRAAHGRRPLVAARRGETGLLREVRCLPIVLIKSHPMCTV